MFASGSSSLMRYKSTKMDRTSCFKPKPWDHDNGLVTYFIKKKKKLLSDPSFCSKLATDRLVLCRKNYAKWIHKCMNHFNASLSNAIVPILNAGGGPACWWMWKSWGYLLGSTRCYLVLLCSLSCLSSQEKLCQQCLVPFALWAVTTDQGQPTSLLHRVEPSGRKDFQLLVQ